VTDRNRVIQCHICKKKFETGHYKQSNIIYYLKDHYMLQKALRKGLVHVCAEHPEEWNENDRKNIKKWSIKGYIKAFIKDIFRWPLTAIGFTWHVITAMFVRIDNLMWGDWL